MSHHINPAGEPITDDDATIAAALEEASVPCLMMSMIHMTGEASLLDGDIRQVFAFLNDMQCAMPAEQQAVVRRRALELIKDYRDRGCTLPPAPTHDTLRRMMSFLVAGEVSEAYVPMMLEEMELDGRDAHAAIHRFGHVVERQRGDGGSSQRFHLDPSLRRRLGRRGDREGRALRYDIDADTGQRNGVAERDEVRRFLGRHDARDACHGEGVALLERAPHDGLDRRRLRL